MDWKKKVEFCFGKTGYDALLTDEAKCDIFSDASYSMKCILSEAISDGSAAYIAETEKDERNVARFFKLLVSSFDEKADKRIREFQQWMKLFTTSLEDKDKCASFINDYELSISILKEHKSVAVQDEALLRTLLLRAIDCHDFAQVKHEVTKDLDLTASAILDMLRKHSHALNTEAALTKTSTSAAGGDPLSIKSRRGGRADESQRGSPPSHFAPSSHFAPMVFY